jgi:Ca2+-binding EF-hand superfamily protein
LSLGLLLPLGSGLRAADPKPATATVAEDPAKLFDQLDVNHKGQLTADEVPADKRHLFERLLRLAGKDANGKLSRDEFIALLKTKEPSVTPPSSDKPAAKPASSEPATPPAGNASRLAPRVLADPGAVFDRLDKNKSGKISAADLPEGRRPLFGRLLKALGKPEGSSLSRDEFIKGAEMLAAKAGSQTPASSSAPATPPREKPAAGKFNAANMDVDALVKRLMQLSKRPDGKLTKADLPERMQGRFDKIDTNGDGLVDETELRDWLTKVKRRLEIVEKAAGKTSN